MTEAIVLYDISQYREALSVLESLVEYEPLIEPTTLSMVIHNRALCHRELGDLDSAESDFVKAVELCERIGADAMRNKAHWHLARVLMISILIPTLVRLLFGRTPKEMPSPEEPLD